MKAIFKILSGVILLVALVGAGILVRNNQETRRGAAANETSSQILPDKVDVKSGSKFGVSVWVNTGKPSDKLVGVEAMIAYDSSKLKFVEFEAASGYTLVNDPKLLDNGNGIVDLKMVAMGAETSTDVEMRLVW